MQCRQDKSALLKRQMMLVACLTGLCLEFFGLFQSQPQRWLSWSLMAAGYVTITCSMVSLRSLPNARFGVALAGVWTMLAPVLFPPSNGLAYLVATATGALLSFLGLANSSVLNRDFDTTEESKECPSWRLPNFTPFQSRLFISILSILGFAVTAYIASYELGYNDRFQDPISGRSALMMLNSPFMQNLPVSVAGLVAAGFFFTSVLSAIGRADRWRSNPAPVFLTAVFTLILSATTVGLSTCQAVEIGSWCGLWAVATVVALTLCPPVLSELILSIRHLCAADTGHREWWHTVFSDETSVVDLEEERQKRSGRNRRPDIKLSA